MGYNNYNNYNGGMPAKPDSNLIWAVLSTCLCCVPLGVVSIVYASKVDSDYASGNYNSAYENAQKARKWAIWAMIAGAVYVFLIIVFYILMILFSVAAS